MAQQHVPVAPHPERARLTECRIGVDPGRLSVGAGRRVRGIRSERQIAVLAGHVQPAWMADEGDVGRTFGSAARALRPRARPKTFGQVICFEGS